MEKRLKPLIKGDDDKLTDAILASAQQIWQAGLGAFSIAEEEGGKLFSRLVKEGTDIQKRSSRIAEVKISDVTGSMTRMSDSVGKQASGSWEKIEQVFEDRVSRTLASLGVPSRKDIQKLNERIEDLSIAVEKLSAKKSASEVAPLKRDTKGSTAAKPVSNVTVKKTASKRKPAKPSASPEPGLGTELVAAQSALRSTPEVTGVATKSPT